MRKIYPPKERKIFSLNIVFLIILLNIVFFVLYFIISYFYPPFIDFVALNPSNLFNKFYIWTLLTSMFMHANLFHLFANMFSLLFTGNLVSKIIGKKRFLSFYLLAGLFAGIFFSLVSLLLRSNFNSYSVGASGALFGLIGLLMMLTPNLPVYLMFIPILIKLKFAAPGMLILLWLISYGGNINIGNTAHLGGFLIGILYGLYLKKKYRNKSKYIREYFH